MADERDSSSSSPGDILGSKVNAQRKGTHIVMAMARNVFSSPKFSKSAVLLCEDTNIPQHVADVAIPTAIARLFTKYLRTIRKLAIKMKL